MEKRSKRKGLNTRRCFLVLLLFPHDYGKEEKKIWGIRCFSGLILFLHDHGKKEKKMWGIRCLSVLILLNSVIFAVIAFQFSCYFRMIMERRKRKEEGKKEEGKRRGPVHVISFLAIVIALQTRSPHATYARSWKENWKTKIYAASRQPEGTDECLDIWILTFVQEKKKWHTVLGFMTSDDASSEEMCHSTPHAHGEFKLDSEVQKSYIHACPVHGTCRSHSPSM